MTTTRYTAQAFAFAADLIDQEVVEMTYAAPDGNEYQIVAIEAGDEFAATHIANQMNLVGCVATELEVEPGHVVVVPGATQHGTPLYIPENN